MAYTRRSRLRRRKRPFTRRRRRRMRTPMTPGRVKRIIDAELKFKDSSIQAISMPSVTGLILNLSSVDQGDAPTERIGNWIKPVSLMGTVTVQANEANAEPLQLFRCFVLQWHENEDVDPITLTKVVQNDIQPYQQFNIQSKGSFKILWNWVGSVIANVDNSQYTKTTRFYVRPRRKVLFDALDNRKYHLFFVAFSNVNADIPTVSAQIRLRYTDS